MGDEKLNALLKTTDNSEMTLEGSKAFRNTKRKINSICKALTKETQRYNPQITVENVDTYLESPNKLDRILYSEISSYVFSLDMPHRGVFATNLEKLLLYSLDDGNHVSENTKRVIIKIYDHVQLALHQIENANSIIAASIDDAKINLQKEIKGTEKEYISILGIFASIILTFVGGITFSTAVLRNIGGVSIFRLLIVVDFLAFILINAVYVLIKFIYEINDKNTKLFDVRTINYSCLVIAIIVITG